MERQNYKSASTNLLYMILYHINCGVIQGFLALRKAATTHVKKYRIFYVRWYSQSGTERHLPLAPLGQVDEWMAKSSRLSIQVVYRSFRELGRLKHLKKIRIADRQWVSNFPRRGKKTNILKENYDHCCFCYHDSTHFSILGVSANALCGCHSGFVDSYFHSLCLYDKQNNTWLLSS